PWWRSVSPGSRDRPQPLEALERQADDAAGVPNVLDVTADELIDERPDARGKDEAERCPRVAVEGELRRPRGLGVAGKRRGEPLRVAVERVLAAAEQITHALGGQRGADESLVHPVTRDRVDEAGSIADQDGSAVRDGIAGPAERQAKAAQAGHDL